MEKSEHGAPSPTRTPSEIPLCVSPPFLKKVFQLKLVIVGRVEARLLADACPHTRPKSLAPFLEPHRLSPNNSSCAIYTWL